MIVFVIYEHAGSNNVMSVGKTTLLEKLIHLYFVLYARKAPTVLSAEVYKLCSSIHLWFTSVMTSTFEVQFTEHINEDAST